MSQLSSRMIDSSWELVKACFSYSYLLVLTCEPCSHKSFSFFLFGCWVLNIYKWSLFVWFLECLHGSIGCLIALWLVGSSISFSVPCWIWKSCICVILSIISITNYLFTILTSGWLTRAVIWSGVESWNNDHFLIMFFLTIFWWQWRGIF